MNRTTPIAIALAGLAAGFAPAAEPGYCTQPALHEDRIVFVSEGDLWTARLPETDDGAPIIAHRLTSGPGEEGHPRFSPDGSRIAFSAVYDGNVDVYVMPVDGGAPERLTFHPGPDHPLAWTPDGGSVLFRSSRGQPLGRAELWRVSARGGMPQRHDFGECSMISLSETGSRFAFTRWSTDHWSWKRYRGGTAPEIWVGDFQGGRFSKLTDDRGNDQFPMWARGRVYFLTDRSGTANLCSDAPQGGDLRTHTTFAPNPADPTAAEGYDVRWPSADAQRRPAAIIFAQAGGLAVLDLADDSIRRLDVRLASDRVASRPRLVDPVETLTEFALAPDGSRLLLGSRGEVMSIGVEDQRLIRISRSAAAREWGATYLGDDRIVLISDAAGEQQIAIAPADGSDLPSLATEDREDWLFPPAGAADGEWIAFGDKTGRLHVMSTITLERREVDRAEAGEITDYRFSPDGRWLAYVKPMPNAMHRVFIHALGAETSFPVSDGRHDDVEPRWDPAGRFLYLLSRRHIAPVTDDVDMEFIHVDAMRIVAVPLTERTPPPVPAAARAAGFDLDDWANPDAKPRTPEAIDDDEPLLGDEPLAAPERGRPPMRIDTDGLADRAYVLPIPAGRYEALEALWGGVCVLKQPLRDLLTDDFGQAGLPAAGGTLLQVDLRRGRAEPLVEHVGAYTASADRRSIAVATNEGLTVRRIGASESTTIDASAHSILVDVRQEWEHIFHEAWRLQRDFYWDPNMVGVDWEAMRTKYAALLPRVGTRAELNDLVGQMIGELGTSHTYIFGGDRREEPDAVNVGLLGIDVEAVDGGLRIAAILPGGQWDAGPGSPLDHAYLNVKVGDYLTVVDGTRITPQTNLHALLQNTAGRAVGITVADDPAGMNGRTLEVTTIASERELRYAAWVEANRRYVEERSEGRVGYVHIPDMGGEGLSVFSRQFYPQVDRRAIVVDVRNNGGGFVSQMIIARLARTPWAFFQPRHGVTERLPARALHAHLAAIIDQHAGSDGDIFPATFRRLGLGPLIGTRTWGGVIGIRGDKPFVDFGLSTQPEYAWWDAETGWSIENEGVSPDIEVPLTPRDRLDGADPQLDRTIDHLLGELERDPKEPPAPPAYPVRSR